MTSPTKRIHREPKRRTRADKGSRKSAYTSKPCASCGSLVVRRTSEVRDSVYCSRECYWDYLRVSKRYSGGRLISPDTTLYDTPWGKRPGYLNSEGYVYVTVPEHPQANSSRKVAHHRLVMEEVLGRFLLPDESVHHKNGIKDDNSVSNLELWTRSQPCGGRVSDKLAWAREFVAKYDGVDIKDVR